MSLVKFEYHCLDRAADRLEKRLSEVTEDRTEGNSDHKQRLKRARLSPGNGYALDVKES